MSASIGSPAASRSPGRADSGGGAEGFTLVEVMVAFAVAALLLVVLARALGSGVVGTTRVKAAAEAAVLAESALDPLGVIAPLKDGDTADLDRGAYHVHVVVERYPESDARRGAGYLTLYRLRATVLWREGQQRRALTLTTLRLGPQG